MSKNNKSHRKTRHKRLIKTFPCQQCLILPICINKFSDSYYYIHTLHDSNLIRLTESCTLLEDYINNTNYYNKTAVRKKLIGQSYSKRERINLVLDFFYSQNQKQREKIINQGV